MKPSLIASLIFYLAAVVSRLPWFVLRYLATLLAHFWRLFNARESRVARRNVELVYPHLSTTEQQQLHHSILRGTALQALETLRFWTHASRDNLHYIRHVSGQALYDAALQSGQGVIVAVPHFGNWELLNQWLASRGIINIVYRPPKTEVADAFLQRVRGVEGVHQIRAESAAVRQLWKALKDGQAVGILPDQQPKAGDGEFAPFFGIQALTMTLLSRLAERSQATVLVAWCERVKDSNQFDIYIEKAPAEFSSPERLKAITALNQVMETIARRDPSQYQWTYKRYSIRPPESGEKNPYQKG